MTDIIAYLYGAGCVGFWLYAMFLLIKCMLFDKPDGTQRRYDT